MHGHYITLRALAVYVVVLMRTSRLVVAEEEPSLTTSTTSTTVIATAWVVVTRSHDDIVTYTTSDTVTGSTLGVTTIAGSTQFAEPTEPATSSVGEEMAWEGKGFRDAVLNSTNLYRSQHQANALTWDKTLASYAQDHADDCKFAHTGGSYGENLAQGYASPALAIDSWANEESKYDYDKRKFSSEAGHFTQLVWKNTTAVGCGAADCDDKGWLLFCEYSPAGNVIGEFGGNVGKSGQGSDGKPGVGDSSTGDKGNGKDAKKSKSKKPQKRASTDLNQRSSHQDIVKKDRIDVHQHQHQHQH